VSPILFPLLRQLASLDAGLMLLIVFVVLVATLLVRLGVASRR
jgi:hypothetical protein